MKRRRLERSGSACNISRCLSVNLYRVRYVEADVNAGQHHCSARRKRRRLASAKEQVDAHIRFKDVNDGQLYCSSRLVSCSLQLLPAVTSVYLSPDDLCPCVLLQVVVQLSRDLCCVEADVNVGQHHRSARRKRRRLASAKEPVDAHIRFPDVNDGQLYCSLRLVSCSLQLVLRESYRPDLMTSAVRRRFD
ncbi:hypothetical protein F511_02149 [Dorcoceras hygrometricum]|uniref:Uncharacterized protein n=1 Tax=Dorcoceras hygrometricum TaxID=472368 RepID=A0A2Z7DAD3_9LAMI|nr:hypothetical protein F511_02149 [Dorcoceras hygrometricum]